MYQNVKRTCRVLFWLINPIVLRRSRGRRRRRRCLSSLVTKVEKNSHWKNRTMPGHLMGPSAAKACRFPRSSGPRYFYCQNFGHLRANCFADQKANAENPPPTK